MKQKVPNVGDCLMLEISYDGKKISLPAYVYNVIMPGKYIPGTGESSSGSAGLINLYGHLLVKNNKTDFSTNDITSYNVAFRTRFTKNKNFLMGGGYDIRIYVEDSDTVSRPNLHAVASELALPDGLVKSSYISILSTDKKLKVNFRKL